MKPILLISSFSVFGLLIFTLACSNKKEQTNQSCTYSKMLFKHFQIEGNKLINEQVVDGCFTKKLVDEQLGLIEITNKTKTIKVSYYQEEDPTMIRILNFNWADHVTHKWRQKQGHDLYIDQEAGRLNFIFGDRAHTMTKGSITFTQ